MPFRIVRNDIVAMEVDAIVNSANPDIIVGRGVDLAIHTAAGTELFMARKFLGKINVGQAKTTDAFNLKARIVIHTVGPLWIDGQSKEKEQLKKCYHNSLLEAINYGCKSIAFPLISTGTYRFPKDVALAIAMEVISEFVLTHEMDVYLVVYDLESFMLSEKLVHDVQAFIDDHYIAEFDEDNDHQITRFRNIDAYHYYPHIDANRRVEAVLSPSIDDLVNTLDDTFSVMLLQLIDNKNLTDAYVYKKANIDRRLFSKIRNDDQYKPSKMTIIAFAVALELTLVETQALLNSAGFALTRSSKFDVIIEYFIREGNYNVFEINEVLFSFEQDCLGV